MDADQEEGATPMINRNNLANTLEQLAAKTDMPRVRSTAQHGIETAKDVGARAAHRAAAIAGGTAGRTRAGVGSLRRSIERADLPTVVRRPVPLGAILAGAAAFGVVIYLVSRRRQ